MKNLFILIGLLTSLFACGQKDDVIKEPTLVGTWKLIEMIEIGAPVAGNVTKYENGKTIRFGADGSYTDSTFDCKGTFSADTSDLKVNIPCSTEKNLRYKFNLENAETLHLTLIPS